MLGRFLNYLLVPYYTNVFSEGEYGVVSILYSSMMFFTIFITFGWESAFLRYGKDDAENKVFVTAFLTVAAQSVLVFLAGWLLVPGLNSAFTATHPLGITLWKYVLCIVVLDAVAIVPFSALRLASKVYVYSGLKLLNVISTLGLNYYLITVQNRGVEAILEANILASAMMLVLVLPFTWRGFLGRPDKEVFNKCLAFGLPYVPAGIGYIVNEFIDRFFMGRMSQADITALYGSSFDALEITGIYSGVYKLSVFMTIGVQMFRMAWQPFFIQHKNDPDYKTLFLKAFVYFNMAAGVLFVLVSLFKEDLVALRVPGMNVPLLNERYWWALYVVPVLLWANWFQGIYTHFTAGVFIKEQTRKLPAITLGGAFITIVLLFFGLPLAGMAAAAVATMVSYGFMSVRIWRISENVMPVGYPLVQTIGLMAFLFTVCMLPFWFSFHEMFIWKLLLMVPAGAAIAFSIRWVRPKSVSFDH